MSDDGNQKEPDEQQPGAGEMSEAEIDRNLMESFPASDPPSWTLGIEHHTESTDQPLEESEQNKLPE